MLIFPPKADRPPSPNTTANGRSHAPFSQSQNFPTFLLPSRSHYEYDLIRSKKRAAMRIEEIPLNQIRRPLPRVNDQTKVAALMESIHEVGLNEPIDVLEVDGQYYGFSGCHRYEACQRLGLETIRCKIRRAPRAVLQMHLA
jgi:sulfiredoxin